LEFVRKDIKYYNLSIIDVIFGLQLSNDCLQKVDLNERRKFVARKRM